MNEGIQSTLHRSQIFSHQPAVFAVRARQPRPPPPYVFACHLLRTWPGDGENARERTVLVVPGHRGGHAETCSERSGRSTSLPGCQAEGTRAFGYGIAHESVMECPIGVCVRAGGRWTIGDPGYGPPECTGCGLFPAEETG